FFRGFLAGLLEVPLVPQGDELVRGAALRLVRASRTRERRADRDEKQPATGTEPAGGNDHEGPVGKDNGAGFNVRGGFRARKPFRDSCGGSGQRKVRTCREK